jgi:hypothetical protein
MLFQPANGNKDGDPEENETDDWNDIITSDGCDNSDHGNHAYENSDSNLSRGRARRLRIHGENGVRRLSARAAKDIGVACFFSALAAEHCRILRQSVRYADDF